MKSIKTEIEIAASTKKVWDVLTDFGNHASWNPFIQSIEGQKTVGSQLTVNIKTSSGKGMTFKPELLKFESNKEFRWKGKLGFKGIFDGEHYFILTELENGNTHFTHGENFSGILVPMMGKILKDTEQGFQQMNRAIKSVCED